MFYDHVTDVEEDYLYDEGTICQGCGAYGSTKMRDKAHNCFRNEDGTYEEGGTFQ